VALLRREHPDVASTIGVARKCRRGLHFTASFSATVTAEQSKDANFVLSITNAGKFAPPAVPPPKVTFDETKLRDVMIVTLQIKSNPARTRFQADGARLPLPPRPFQDRFEGLNHDSWRGVAI
jgi:hypothetical protein